MSQYFLTLWQDPLYRFISIVIGVELVLIGVQLMWLSFLTLRGKYHENRWRSFEKSLQPSFRTAIQNEDDRTKWVEDVKGYPTAVQRRFLDTMIATTNGSIRGELVRLYHDLGLPNLDMQDLQSSLWHRRVLAMRRLHKVAASEDVHLFEPLEEDTHTNRVLAAQIMARIGKAPDVFGVLKDLRLHNRLMEQPVFAMFTRMPEEKFATLLDHWNEFECDFIRRILLIVASEKTPGLVEDWLEEATASPSKDIRIGAAIAAAKLTTRESAELLRHLLRDPDWEVRAQAAKAFGIREDGADFQELEQAMRDQSYWVRQNAAASLSQTGLDGRKRLAVISKRDDDVFAADAARQEIERYQLGMITEGRTS